MNYIGKIILCFFLVVFFIIAFIFALCWYYDGFSVAWITFLAMQIPETVFALFSAIGVLDWLIAAIIALVIVGLYELLVGHRLSNKKVCKILDIVLFVVSFIGYILLLK